MDTESCTAWPVSNKSVATQTLNIVTARSENEIHELASLAAEIWHEHFTPIIGLEQVEYMLEKFQSAAAIRQQIDSGAIYLMAHEKEANIGYACLIPDISTRSAQLSKLYLLYSVRGRGLGRELLANIESLCLKMDIERLWLTVNRHNSGPISAYQKMGFSKTDEVVMDIGGGYVMDDFIMEKRLSSQP